jgi:drug/metabolite transporter (DMT)-like permease
MGVVFALAAGLMWGLVFVVPLLLPDYPPVLLSCGRYLAFGLIALPLGWFDRKEILRLTRADWIEAFRLAAVGNLLYYVCLAAAIQRVGVPLPTMIIGALPLVISISANVRNHHRDGLLPWRQLVPSLLLIAAGVACVNWVESAALAGYLLVWLWVALSGDSLSMPWGPRPPLFVGSMVAVGLLASWLGTMCWNEASQRLPTALAGSLIVFETVAALTYAYLLRGTAPPVPTTVGVLLLLGGVCWAMRIRPVRTGVVPQSQ